MKLDRKGIGSFIAITFGLTWLIEFALISTGFRMTAMPPIMGQLVIAAVMWVPALATILTVKFVTGEGFAITNLRFGSWKPYLVTALLIPSAFVLIYGLTWLLGFGVPDWALVNFKNTLSQAGADLATFPSASQVLPGIFLATLLVSPFINSIFAFGEEFGWRGYLLPKLMPMGKTKAYLVLGIIWGLWHAPLILVGFNYPGYPILGIVMMMLFTTTMGIIINEYTLAYRSSILAGWMHGVINSQGYGVWRILFADSNPVLGGIAGLVGAVVWLVLGIVMMRRFRVRREKHESI